MNEPISKIDNLSKTLKSGSKKFVLENISFELFPSEITALIGLNGAGKTTLIKLILSLLQAESGLIKFHNSIYSSRGIKKIGYLPETFTISDFDFTVKSFLNFMCVLNHIPSAEINTIIDEVLNIVGLTTQKKHSIKKLSKGMKTRMGLAQALIGDPLILILDEPTDGLDPQGRKDIMELLKKLKENGRAILISSHVLSEIENVADKILILNNGKLLFNGAIEDVLSNGPNTKFKSLEELFFFTLKENIHE